MKNVPKDSAVFTLSKDWRIWNRFEAECRHRGVITLAFMMVSRGQAKEYVIGRYTAFQLLEPEAEAWLRYFRGVGAIASAQQPDHSVAAQKTEFNDCTVWSEAVNDYVLF